MTKADIVNEISKSTGIPKADALRTVEAFMDIIKTSVSNEENVYLRGFGSFIVKKRKRHKMSTHKRKKRLRKNRHKSKK